MLPRYKAQQKKIPSLEDFLGKRDYIGALVLLNFDHNIGREEPDNSQLWAGYCAFHQGNFEKAKVTYMEIIKENDPDKTSKEVSLYLACVNYHMQMYQEAEIAVLNGPDGCLKNRILLHLDLKKRESDKRVNMLNLQGFAIEKDLNDISVAALKYKQSHYEEAIEILKQLLKNNKNYLALHFYIAMCYFKLGFHDVSLETLKQYLQVYSESYAAANLKACNYYCLFHGKVPENELKIFEDLPETGGIKELIRHNIIVFSNGEKALQVFPSLIDIIPESRLNLGIFYLKHGQADKANELLKDLNPSTPQECSLKAIVYAILGQEKENPDLLTKANNLFLAVGSSSSNCDTVLGRQCMASHHFMLREFEDVVTYLQSVKSYMSDSDEFNWNYGVSLTMRREYKSGEEALLFVKNDKYKIEICYIICLCKCFIMNGRPEKAWNLYSKMENSNKSLYVVQLIANESYRMGQFLYAAKAFDVLEKQGTDLDFWEGKRGACIGMFQEVLASKQGNEKNFKSSLHRRHVKDIIRLLETSSNPESEYIQNKIKIWSTNNGLNK